MDTLKPDRRRTTSSATFFLWLLTAVVIPIFSVMIAGCGFWNYSAATPAETSGAFTDELGMTFVYIQPGRFLMGSPRGEPKRDDDEKRDRVKLNSGFYLQSTETTQGQWQLVMGDNPSRFKNCGEDCPVEQVSWNEVQVFIQRLNQRTGRQYRLPTEAEWEYACRAGTTGPFNTGACLSSEQANFDGDFPLAGCPQGIKMDTTVAVKSFLPNAWGLYDMHGNVWEWCMDRYGSYRSGRDVRSVDPSSESVRVFRGGGWSSGARGCRSAERNWRLTDFAGSFIGFRLALDP